MIKEFFRKLTIFFSIYLITFAPVLAEMNNNALPTNPNITSGSATINQTSNSLTINQTTNKLITNWSSFNIGKDASVEFVQPNSSSTALNRVNASDPSYIYGSLKANGKIILINPSGVLFQGGSKVDVGAIIASSLNLQDGDFLNDQYIFEKDGLAGTVNNSGTINAFKGGAVALLSDQVTNNGTINTPEGTTALLSGEKITLTLNGNRLIKYTIDRGTLNALVENKQAINAGDGIIILSAKGLSDVSQSVVKNTGTLKAESISKQGGKIYLSAREGEVINSGTISTNSTDDQGGNIEITGDQITIEQNSTLTATGKTGGGQILVGGSWQNSDSSVYQSTVTTVEQNTLIDASATLNGDGGEIVIWSDITNNNSITTVNGTLYAKGGSQGGDGGRIETSGYNLDSENASISTNAKYGNNGIWLLDPYSLYINDTDSSIDDFAANGSLPLSGYSKLNLSTLYTRLAGNNVTLEATNDINLAAEFNYTGIASSLTLDAPTIVISGNITSSNALGLTIGKNDNSQNIFLSGTSAITSGNGDIILYGNTGGAQALTINSGTGTATLNSAIGGFSGSYWTGATNVTGSSSTVIANTIRGVEASINFSLGTITIDGADIIISGTMPIGSVGFADGDRLDIPSGSGKIYYVGNSTPTNIDIDANRYTFTSDTAGVVEKILVTPSNGSNATITIPSGVTSYTTQSISSAPTLSSLSFYGRDITLTGSVVVAGDITATASQDIIINTDTITSSASNQDIILRAKRDITTQTNDTTSLAVTSTGGNILFTSDTDNSDGGGILIIGGTVINSNGGNITFAGGDLSGSGYATGRSVASSGWYIEGLRIDGTSNVVDIDSDGGNIIMRGKTSNNSGTGTEILDGSHGAGLSFYDGNIDINSGTGTLYLEGQSYTYGPAAPPTHGFNSGIHIGLVGSTYSFNLTSSNTTSDAIRIVGNHNINSTAGKTYGVQFYQAGTIAATGSGGGIRIDTDTAGDVYGLVAIQELNILAASGPIQLLDTRAGGILYFGAAPFIGSKSGSSVTSSLSDITIQSDAYSWGSNNPNISTTGAVTVKPYSNSFPTESYANADVRTGWFDWNDNSEVMSSLTFGKSTNETKILINQSITSSGDISILAPVAADTADVEISSGVSVTTTGDNKTIVIAAGDDFVNNSGSSALVANGTGSRWIVYTADDNTTGNFNSLNSSNTPVWASTYSSLAPASVSSGNRYVFAESAPAQTITFTTTDASKVYGSTIDLSSYYTITSSGTPGLTNVYSALSAGGSVPIGDVFSSNPTFSTSGSDGTLANADVGDYTITAASGTANSGYTVSYANTGTLSISAKPITVSGITASNKTYNGNTTATIDTSTVNQTGIGILADDAVTISATGLFSDKNVGSSKTVTLTSSYGGADATNYTFTDQSSTTADITAKSISSLTLSASNKTYDGNTSATVSITSTDIISDDTVTFTNSAVFDDRHVDTGKTVTVSSISISGGSDQGNYTLATTSGSTTADVTQLASVTWNGNAGDGLWSSASNWVGGALPDQTNVDSVVIPSGESVTFDSDTVGTIGSTIANSGALTFNGATDYTFAQVISGTGSLVKSNSNTLILSANNTYTGDTTVASGTLNISGQLGSGNYAGDISNSGAFNYSSSSSQTLSGVISSTGTLTQSGSGTLTLSGTNTYSGATTISAGTLLITGKLGNGSYSNTISNSGILSYSSNSNQVLSGIISGTGSVVKSGSGDLTLSAMNTYSGGSTVNAGTLFGGAGSQLNTTFGSGAITVASGAKLWIDRTEDGVMTNTLNLNGGTLQGTNGFGEYWDGSIVLGADSIINNWYNFIVDGVISGSYGITKTQNGNLKLRATNTYTGDTTISSGTITVSGLLGNGSYAGDISNAGTLAFNATSDQTISGVISGAGDLTKLGSNTLLLSGSNTYTGDTVISAGTLAATNAAALGNTSGTSTVSDGATLRVSGGINIAETIILNGSGVSSKGALYFLSGDNTYSGNITLGSNSTITSDAGNQTVSGTINDAHTLGITSAANWIQSGIIGGISEPTQLTFSSSGSFQNTAAINIAGPISITGTTLNLDDDITSSATGDILLQSTADGASSFDLAAGKSISKSGGDTSTLTVKSNGMIRGNAANITSVSGTPLNVVLWSNYDGDTSDGGISLPPKITTYGGHVWMGGSTSDGDGTSTWNGLTVGNGGSIGGGAGSNANSLDLNGSVITSGGDIWIRAGNGTNDLIGLFSTSYDDGENPIALNALNGDIIIEANEVVAGDVTALFDISTTGSFTFKSYGDSFDSNYSGLNIQGSLSGTTFTGSDDFAEFKFNDFANLTGFTIGKSTNTADVTLSSDISIAGPITVYGGNITSTVDLTSTAASSAIKLLATGDLKLQTNRVALTTNGGDLLLLSDTNGDGAGQVRISNGINASTSGGAITVAGGNLTGTGYAVGTNTSTAEGIRMEGDLDFNSAGGNITFRGKSRDATDAGSAGIGIYNSGSTLDINSGTGEITIVAVSQASNTSNSNYDAGLYLHGTNKITSAKTSGTAITIVADGTGTSLSTPTTTGHGDGFLIAGGTTTIQTTAGGAIDIDTYGTTQEAGQQNIEPFGVLNILSSSGAISVDGLTDTTDGIYIRAGGYIYLGAKSGTDVTSSTANITLRDNTFNWPSPGQNPRINTLGTFTFAPVSTSFGYNLSTNAFTFDSNPSGLTFGKEGNTANIIVNETHAVTGPITIFGDDITISSSRTLTAGTNSDIVLSAASNFINNSGASALNVSGTGRWIVYSANDNTPANFGSLNSANTPIWSSTYSSLAPASVSSGNRYVFAESAPTQTITFTTTDASKVYGSTIDLSSYYTITSSGTPGLTNVYSALSAGSSVPIGDVFSSNPTFSTSGSDGTLANADVGDYTITAASGTANSGYTVSYANTGTLSISAKPITVSGITASNKTYNGNTTATIDTSTVNQTGIGILADDAVTISATGLFSDKNVGSSKTVTLTSSYGGADATNYTFTDQSSTTADITAKAITVSGITASDKVFDDTTSATIDVTGINKSGIGIVSGDTVNIAATGTFNNKNAATNKTVTLTSAYSGADATNYTFTDQASTTADVTKASPSISGLSNQTKTTSDSSFTVAGTSSISGLTINYTSSDTGVATVNSSTGAVTIVGAGTATITASTSGTVNYNVATSTYTLTVTQASGSSSNAQKASDNAVRNATNSIPKNNTKNTPTVNPTAGGGGIPGSQPLINFGGGFSGGGGANTGGSANTTAGTGQGAGGPGDGTGPGQGAGQGLGPQGGGSSGGGIINLGGGSSGGGGANTGGSANTTAGTGQGAGGPGDGTGPGQGAGQGLGPQGGGSSGGGIINLGGGSSGGGGANTGGSANTTAGTGQGAGGPGDGTGPGQGAGQGLGPQGNNNQQANNSGSGSGGNNNSGSGGGANTGGGANQVAGTGQGAGGPGDGTGPGQGAGQGLGPQGGGNNNQQTNNNQGGNNNSNIGSGGSGSGGGANTGGGANQVAGTGQGAGGPGDGNGPGQGAGQGLGPQGNNNQQANNSGSGSDGNNNSGSGSGSGGGISGFFKNLFGGGNPQQANNTGGTSGGSGSGGGANTGGGVNQVAGTGQGAGGPGDGTGPGQGAGQGLGPQGGGNNNQQANNNQGGGNNNNNSGGGSGSGGGIAGFFKNLFGGGSGSGGTQQANNPQGGSPSTPGNNNNNQQANNPQGGGGNNNTPTGPGNNNGNQQANNNQGGGNNNNSGGGSGSGGGNNPTNLTSSNVQITSFTVNTDGSISVRKSNLNANVNVNAEGIIPSAQVVVLRPNQTPKVETGYEIQIANNEAKLRPLQNIDQDFVTPGNIIGSTQFRVEVTPGQAFNYTIEVRDGGVVIKPSDAQSIQFAEANRTLVIGSGILEVVNTLGIPADQMKTIFLDYQS